MEAAKVLGRSVGEPWIKMKDTECQYRSRGQIRREVEGASVKGAGLGGTVRRALGDVKGAFLRYGNARQDSHAGALGGRATRDKRHVVVILWDQPATAGVWVSRG